MENIQDLLDPANDNISIVEDPKTGDVSLPGATIVEIRDQQNYVELLKLGEAHRVAANTKLNAESSRSHAILMVSDNFILLFFVFFSWCSRLVIDPNYFQLHLCKILICIILCRYMLGSQF